MEDIDDIDIVLTLSPNGWSYWVLFLEAKTFDFRITHIFNYIYSDLMQSLLNLIRGEKQTEFNLYDEPGGHKFEIKKLEINEEKVEVLISQFMDSSHQEIKKHELVVAFEIKIKRLIIIFYFQLQKNYFLLKDKDFAQNRAKNFPFHDFHKFESIIKSFLGL